MILLEGALGLSLGEHCSRGCQSIDLKPCSSANLYVDRKSSQPAGISQYTCVKKFVSWAQSQERGVRLQG